MPRLVVIHTEALGEPKVRARMKEFGRSMRRNARPIATVTTPLSACYRGVDGFADSLKELDGLFEIGYHGHFVNRSPRVQFNAEVKLVRDAGFDPKVYAGGWWLMDAEIEGLLKENQFEIDTTMNDMKVDSFGRPQMYWPDITEAVTMRRWSSLFSRQPKTVCMSFHDYNLGNPLSTPRILAERFLA